MIDSYALLTRFLRLHGDDAYYQQLQQELATFDDWHIFIPLAEEHSLAPLVYQHIQNAQITIPAAPKLQLQGLFLRHRQANQALMIALDDILTSLGNEQISAVLLKGAALAHIVYPQIGLRPMRDLDILVPLQKGIDAQILLQKQGFQLPDEDKVLPDNHRHLDVLQTECNGRIVSVEIHTQLLSGLMHKESKNYDSLKRPFLTFSIGHTTAQTLNPDETLWHLYKHMISESTRLIRIVDLVGFAEAMQTKIDWQYVRIVYPVVIEVLSLLHFVMPLSNSLREAARIPSGKRPSGAERPLQDWPPLPRAAWQSKNKSAIYRSTFFPSEFSVRMVYGIGSHRSALKHRALIHPLQIIRGYIARRK